MFSERKKKEIRDNAGLAISAASLMVGVIALCLNKKPEQKKVERTMKNRRYCDEINIASYNRRAERMTDQELTEIFARVGEEYYGMDNVSADFVGFSDFKIRWERTNRSICFHISDYLAYAPDDVMEGVADHILNMITGGDDDGFSEVVLHHFNSRDFWKINQPTFIRRKKFTRTSRGPKDLGESLHRLVEDGLVSGDLEGVAVVWNGKSSTKAYEASVLNRVVGVTKVLDDPDVPDYVLDYVVYVGLCHIMIGFDPDGSKHARKMLGLKYAYPMKEEACDWLDDHGMRD